MRKMVRPKCARWLESLKGHDPVECAKHASKQHEVLLDLREREYERSRGSAKARLRKFTRVELETEVERRSVWALHLQCQHNIKLGDAQYVCSTHVLADVDRKH